MRHLNPVPPFCRYGVILLLTLGFEQIATAQLCPASVYSLHWADPSPISIVVGSDSSPQNIYFAPNAQLPSICPPQVSIVTSTWSTDTPTVALISQCPSANECAVYGQGVGHATLRVSASSISNLVSGELIGLNSKDVYVTSQPQQPPDGCVDQAYNAVPCGGSCTLTSATSAIRPSARLMALAPLSTEPSCQPQSNPIQIITSGDPNDKVGNKGAGSPQYVRSGQATNYSIYFDNIPTATAPAQKVMVTDQLTSSVVDMSTVSLGKISFVNNLITPPSTPLATIGTYSTNVDLRPAQNLIVNIVVALNQNTGILTWTYTSLDPSTMQPTTDPLAGFLPPGTEGSVSFSVTPKPAATGTQVTNQATVVFDVNPPINTPIWANTIDSTRPVSKVSALPTPELSPSFSVQWSGTDVGAGVQDYTIYVSDNAGSFTAWLTNTTATQGNYIGSAGHSYGFYSIARDLVGNIETSKTMAEATTNVTTAVIIPSTQVATTASGLAYSRVTQTFNGTVTVKNIGTTMIAGPLEVVFTALPSGVTLANATGSIGGLTYLTLSSASLVPGQSATVNVQFQNPGNVQINFTPVIYSGGF
jgi:hypothetical protein